ncbi:MAG: radical SAM protein [Clostridiales bacterium]|nr:radical SAM protein [Clostridiales bacterium]
MVPGIWRKGEGAVEKAFDLGRYLSQGVEEIMRSALRVAVRNPAQAAYLAQFALAVRRAGRIRGDWAQKGVHVPPFLIASITSDCNLRCAGCYAHASRCSADCRAPLSADRWRALFGEAAALGVAFILLAGGEPTLRTDVLAAAAGREDILFPVFTNGTTMDGEVLALFADARNLIPIFSVEGGRGRTDARRGGGVYDGVATAMAALKGRQKLFGASITATAENLDEATGEDFAAGLSDAGAKIWFYVEYVPMGGDEALALDDGGRVRLEARLNRLREAHREALVLSFPGDERAAGGCLAAGRGFFHINDRGGAEPCPFSPFSDVSLADRPLIDALTSPLFRAITSGELMLGGELGGCALKRREAEAARAISHNK